MIDHESSLIDSAVAGDRLALGKLLLAEHAAVLDVVNRRADPWLRRIVDDEDLVQQIYAKVIERIGSFDSRSTAAFRAWLLTLAERHVLDVAEAQMRLKRGPKVRKLRLVGRRDRSSQHSSRLRDSSLAGGSETPGSRMARLEAVDAIRAGIAALPTPQRQAVVLHYSEGATVAEIASRIGRSPGGVRGLLQRARAALRDLLRSSSRWFSSR
jgi:RNA polymerase sigma-70 factor (ECF subfamily)